MRHPINRQRGGSIFTMVIFVMMLISTALMYYYFQRSRSLERDLFALKNGEPLPSESGGGLFGFMGWDEAESESDDAQPTSQRAAATPAPPSERLATTNNETAANIQNASQAAAVIQPVVATQNSGLTGATSNVDSELSSAPLAQDRLAPAEQFSTAEAPNSDSAASNFDGNNAAQNSPSSDGESPSDPAAAEGQSLYNMDPPTVRVRAPRR